MVPSQLVAERVRLRDERAPRSPLVHTMGLIVRHVSALGARGHMPLSLPPLFGYLRTQQNELRTARHGLSASVAASARTGQALRDSDRPQKGPQRHSCGPFAVPRAGNSREQARTADRELQRFRGYSRMFPAVPSFDLYRGGRRFIVRCALVRVGVGGFMSGWRLR
jgi:hypothetical protein